MRRRETVINERFLDGRPAGRVEKVKTVQTADIIDGPTLPDPRAHVKVSSPGWVPETIYVADEVGVGDKDGARRMVAIYGRHLKKDGTLGSISETASWRSYETFTGTGSMARLPRWVNDLMATGFVEADPGVLVQAPIFEDAAQ
jgi:hypothetical protein